MLVLAIDTGASTGGVLLARNKGAGLDPGETEVLGESCLEPREFSTQLIPAVAEALQANHLRVSDLDVFAVVSGPGSFTGLRIGLSAVKAMAEVTAKPIIALSRLAIMVSAALSPKQAGETVHAVLDAGRGEFYHGVYRDDGRTCMKESLQTQAGLNSSLKDFPGPVVASEAAILDVIGIWPGVALQSIPAITVRESLPLIFSAWQNRRFTDVAQLDANYLRSLEVQRLSGMPMAAKPADVSAGGL